jgi:hypothetical protein
MFDIYDKDGVKRDAAWLTGKYGNVRVQQAAPGLAFRLIAIFETEGPSVIKVEVRGESGGPHPTQPVANYYPNNDGIDLSGGGLKTLPYTKALMQRTDAAGVTGFGIANGSYYTPPDTGAHTLWVLSPSLSSDVVSGIGMLPETEHMGPLHLVFQIKQAGEVPVDPEQPLPDGTVLALLRSALDKVDSEKSDLEAALSKIDSEKADILAALTLLGG